VVALLALHTGEQPHGVCRARQGCRSQPLGAEALGEYLRAVHDGHARILSQSADSCATMQTWHRASPSRSRHRPSVWGGVGRLERWSEWTETVTWVRRLDEEPLLLESRAEINQPKPPSEGAL
jgi:hypothetical protein